VENHNKIQAFEAQQSVYKFIVRHVVNLVTPKEAAKLLSSDKSEFLP